MAQQGLDTDTAVERDQLVSLIRDRSLQTGAEMKLASGRTSSFYFNMKPTMLHHEGARLIASLIITRMKKENALPDLVGGLEMGAVPIASSVAACSTHLGHPVSAFFVRKQAKEHGTQSLIEGLSRDDTMNGKRVVVVEDVTTTGGSSLKAVGQLRDAGALVLGVITVVDRQEGAAAAFADAGIAFWPLLTKVDFGG